MARGIDEVLVTVRPDSGEVQVWIQLEPGNPVNMDHSFIIGLGDTFAEAVQDALREVTRIKAELEEML